MGKQNVWDKPLLLWLPVPTEEVAGPDDFKDILSQIQNTGISGERRLWVLGN